MFAPGKINMEKKQLLLLSDFAVIWLSFVQTCCIKYLNLTINNLHLQPIYIRRNIKKPIFF